MSIRIIACGVFRDALRHIEPQRFQQNVTITYINPMRYYMVILRGVFLEATPFHLLVNQLWPMAAIGLMTLVFAGWLFRRRMQ